MGQTEEYVPPLPVVRKLVLRTRFNSILANGHCIHAYFLTSKTPEKKGKESLDGSKEWAKGCKYDMELVLLEQLMQSSFALSRFSNDGHER